MLVVHNPTRSNSICADKHPLVHAGPEEIDRDERCFCGWLSIRVFFLAKQHREPFQALVTV